MRKDDADLLAKLDKTLGEMKKDGAAGIATQWFGANIIK